MTYRTKPKCVITGCGLVVDHGSRWVWGDLHRIGNSYAFNAVLTDEGEAAWSWDFAELPLGSCIRILYFDDLYEKRGVIVFCSTVAVFNETAFNRLARSQ